ncbi:MAG: glycosyltransferase [Rikenellaceae bacterium]|nr:glycosyltransferase [Rikenellaceae bacterium]MCC8112533.1 glycosyltransferase [Bacteroidales bacterium]
MERLKISIVANFYNSQRFIPKLLRSVANQTYKEWHLICIDDCSPRQDIKALKKWVKKLGIEDKTTIVKNEQNLGIAQSKGKGIKISLQLNPNGYTTFIDGDDWLEPDALETFYNEIKADGAEVVVASYNHYYKAGPFTQKNEDKKCLPIEVLGRTYYQPEAIERFLINFMGVYQFHYAYWAKAYRNELLARLEFDFPAKEDSAREDFFFSLAVMLQCNSIRFTAKPVYNWRWGGITAAKGDPNWTAEKIVRPYFDSYLYRKSLIEQYHYEKGRIPLLRDMKGNCIGLWSQLAVEPIGSEGAAKIQAVIGRMLQHKSFEDITPEAIPQIALNDWERDFLTAVVSKDAAQIYAYCHQFHQAGKRFSPRRAIFWLLGKMT